jgi:hypothetical protein
MYDSAKAYGQTLRKAEQIMEAHGISVLVPGHGQTTSSQEEMKRRIQVSKGYLERLIAAVMKEDVEELTILEKEMSFPSSFTKQCHEENIAIIRREFKNKETNQ